MVGAGAIGGAQGGAGHLRGAAGLLRDALGRSRGALGSVQVTVEHDLPFEVAYLQAHDRFIEGVTAIADMLARTLDLLHRFLRRGGGRLSQRARWNEFGGLRDEEVARIEGLYATCAGGLPKDPALLEESADL